MILFQTHACHVLIIVSHVLISQFALPASHPITLTQTQILAYLVHLDAQFVLILLLVQLAKMDFTSMQMVSV